MKICLQLGVKNNVHLPLCSLPCIRLAFPFLSLREERLEVDFRLGAGWATIENKQGKQELFYFSFKSGCSLEQLFSVLEIKVMYLTKYLDFVQQV